MIWRDLDGLDLIAYDRHYPGSQAALVDWLDRNAPEVSGQVTLASRCGSTVILESPTEPVRIIGGEFFETTWTLVHIADDDPPPCWPAGYSRFLIVEQARVEEHLELAAGTWRPLMGAHLRGDGCHRKGSYCYLCDIDATVRWTACMEMGSESVGLADRRNADGAK